MFTSRFFGFFCMSAWCAVVLGAAGIRVAAEEVRPGVFRTPDERFENLPGYPFEPNYMDVRGLRVHYVDEGPKDAEPVLLLHGEPSWSYLYRKMIPIVVEAGYRAIAPDLIGFGKSDKPAKREDYSYQMEVDVMTELVKRLDLKNITLFCQDWGGLVGLRIAAENEERFARIIAANTGLPAGNGPDGMLIGQQWTEPDPNASLDLGSGFMAWLQYSQSVPELPIGDVVQAGTLSELPPEIVAAYDAPFPDKRYKAGARVLPALVMSQQKTNQRAWAVFEQWEKPFLTAFSDSDPVTGGGAANFQNRIPGAKDQPHTVIKNASHFLQEDKGEELGKLIVDFIAATK